jgi:hypothetical protein
MLIDDKTLDRILHRFVKMITERKDRNKPECSKCAMQLEFLREALLLSIKDEDEDAERSTRKNN